MKTIRLNENIIIESYAVGDLGANCYLLIHEQTGEVVVIDPGGSGSILVRRMLDRGQHVTAIWLTHGHYDHMHHARMVAEEFGAPVWIHEKEKELIRDPEANASTLFGFPEIYSADHYFKDGDLLHFAELEIKVIWTPGHTIGGVCFYLEQYGILFSGDTLFRWAQGRTDLKTGSADDLERSIRDKLMMLPDDVNVLPGHMTATTIGNERPRFK